jgi:hypothetical protein
MAKTSEKKMVGNMDLLKNGWVIGLKSKWLLETTSFLGWLKYKIFIYGR